MRTVVRSQEVALPARERVRRTNTALETVVVSLRTAFPLGSADLSLGFQTGCGHWVHPTRADFVLPQMENGPDYFGRPSMLPNRDCPFHTMESDEDRWDQVQLKTRTA